MNQQRLAHEWANMAKASGKSSSLFYEGLTIYSYGHHFPIATLFPAQALVLLTTQTRSVTTAKHKTLAREAIPGHYTVIRVPDVVPRTKADHRENYLSIRLRVKNLLPHLTFKSHRRFDELESLYWMMAAYTKAFKLGFRPAKPAARAQLLKETQQLRKRFQDSKKKKEAARAAVQAARAEAWVNHNPDTPTPRPPLHYLRIMKSNPEVVETSSGAEVPLAHVKRAWKLIERYYQVPTPSLPTIRLGYYQVTNITSEGVVVVGCHRFEKAEVIRFSNLL